MTGKTKGYNEKSFAESIIEIAMRSGITGAEIRFGYDDEHGRYVGRSKDGVVFTGNSTSYRIGVKQYMHGKKRFESQFVPEKYATEKDRKMGVAIA